MISAEPEATRATTEAGTRHIPIRYYKRKDGSIFPVEITTSHVALHGHNIIIGAVRDITDRKKIEDVLKVSEQRLRSALNSGRSGVWEWDLGTEENFWSDELWDLYGIARNSFTPSHETWLKTVRPENREKIEGAVMEAVRTGSDLNIEWLVDTNDGTYRWLMSRGRPVKDSTGAVVKYIGVVIDITERKRAEEELTRKNYEVESANEELTITGEELRKNEAKLTASLEEKEALLSEIHHRVKNNLAAFISLLSLEGSYEATERGTALRKDLQNRARSMALIHETIYKTKKFSSVDMGVYLQTLTDHVAVTYRTDTSVRTVVNAGGFSLDLNRSTPCGLIVNELITNAFKYAFPASFSCESARKEPCTIWVTFTLENGYYLLSVRDNGVGLPETFDPVTAKSLGLKLVNFLAKHQLRANIEVSRKEGTEFLIRFRENL
jgi:PAS domain S-box-containing protein